MISARYVHDKLTKNKKVTNKLSNTLKREVEK
jgi:hypothetical protein